eukprot:scaffold250603_cov35-Tisochrysis_lutea.AAC.1
MHARSTIGCSPNGPAVCMTASTPAMARESESGSVQSHCSNRSSLDPLSSLASAAISCSAACALRCERPPIITSIGAQRARKITFGRAATVPEQRRERRSVPAHQPPLGITLGGEMPVPHFNSLLPARSTEIGLIGSTCFYRGPSPPPHRQTGEKDTNLTKDWNIDYLANTPSSAKQP